MGHPDVALCVADAIPDGLAASLLTPGRVGILLMSDLLVGVISAALYAGEPFGWREGADSLLIIGAALVEVLGKRAPDLTTAR